MSVKRQRFANLYDGDGKHSAIKAGYKKANAASVASRLLKVPAIIKIIKARQNKIKKIAEKSLIRKEKVKEKKEIKEIMSKQDRMQFLSNMAQNIQYEPRDRIKCVETLGKMCGDFLGKEPTDLTRNTIYNIIVQAREQRGLPNKGQKVIEAEGE